MTGSREKTNETDERLAGQPEILNYAICKLVFLIPLEDEKLCTKYIILKSNDIQHKI